MAVNGKVFAHLAQVNENGTHVTASDHLNILHLAHILIVRAVRAHHTTPGITRQIIVCTERHLEHRQMLVIYIGVADIRIDILVKFGIVAMPNEFTLVLVVLAFDVCRRIPAHAARRRSMVPGEP